MLIPAALPFDEDENGMKNREAQLPREAFRYDRGLYMTCRRGIILTACGAGLCMMVAGLYRTGLIRRPRDAPWS